jgi:hypothetical protein
MKVGGVGQDCHFRMAAGGGCNQLPKAAPDARKVADYFEDSDHRQVFRTDYRLDACGTEVRPGASEELAFGPAAAEFFDEARRVEIARSLAR